MKARSILKIFLLIFSFVPAISHALETSARHAYVIDYETGTVLFQKDAETRMPTASMSKVMTMVAVFKALEDGRLSLSDELPVSEKAWRKQGSKMFVEVGKKVKVEDLIRGVIIQSGNDATIVLAEALAGTEEAFAAEMTKLAKEIGMENSNFTNASGWPDENHYSTAKDLAILARHLIQTYPQYYKYYSELEFTFNNIPQGNRNPLLYRDIGADGIKTGHTSEAGYGLIGSGERDGRRVILVLAGMDGVQERADESARLLEWGLRNFANKTLFAADKIITDIDVVLGDKKKLPLRVAENLSLTIPLEKSKDIQAEAVFDSPVIAPVQAGDQIGTLVISIPSYGVVERPLIAAEPVSEADFFSKTLEKISLFIRQNS